MEFLAIVVGILLAVYFWRLSLFVLLLVGSFAAASYFAIEAEDARRARYEASPAGLAEKAKREAEAEQQKANERFERDERIKLSRYWRGVAIPANGKAVYFGPYSENSLSACQMDLLRALRAAGSLNDGEGRCALVDPHRVGSAAAEVKTVEYVMGQWPVR